jgi:hypothetical protein
MLPMFSSTALTSLVLGALCGVVCRHIAAHTCTNWGQWKQASLMTTSPICPSCLLNDQPGRQTSSKRLDAFVAFVHPCL